MPTTTKSKKVTTRTTPARRFAAMDEAPAEEPAAEAKAAIKLESKVASRGSDPTVVAELAYKLFEESGHQHGRDQEHWFRAEAILSRT
jgi:hypothetical protein